MGLYSIENVLRRGLLRFYGHLQCIDPDIWPRKENKTIATGSNPRGRSRKTRLDCIKDDLKGKGLEASLSQNRIARRWTLNPKTRCGRDNEVVQPSDTGNSAL